MTMGIALSCGHAQSAILGLRLSINVILTHISKSRNNWGSRFSFLIFGKITSFSFSIAMVDLLLVLIYTS